MFKHEEIYESLKSGIESGEYAKGEQLPIEKELCRRFEVSRITVMRALNDLAKTGLVERVAGRGTFVKSDEDKVGKAYHLIIPQLNSQYYSSMADSFCCRLAAENCMGEVMVYKGYNVKILELLLSKITKQNSSGIAIVASGDRDVAKSTLKLLEQIEVPLIPASRELPDFAGIQVIVDEHLAGTMAVEHLLKLGHKRIVYAGPSGSYTSAEIRFHACKETCLKNKIDFVHLPNTDIIALKEFKSCFSGRNSATAVITASELHAVETYDILTTLNFQVPKQIALVTLDGGMLSPSIEVPVTAVNFSGHLVGEKLAECFLQVNQGEGKPDKNQIIKIKPELFVRASCGENPAKYRHEYLREILDGKLF